LNFYGAQILFKQSFIDKPGAVGTSGMAWMEIRSDSEGMKIDGNR
jgi:hypothetical protein